MTVRRPTTLAGDADSILGNLHNASDIDDRPITAERRLWMSVIARAWLDAFEASDWFLRASESKLRHLDFDPAMVRQEARRWLTLDFGEWKSYRETVCDLAGVDEQMLRNAARCSLNLVKADQRPTVEIVNLDTMFAALLDREGDGEDSDELDAALERLARLEVAA